MIENQNNRVAMAVSTRSQPFLRALEIIDLTYYKTLICKNNNCTKSGICSYLDIRAHGNGNNNTKKRVWCKTCETSKTIDRLFLRPNDRAFKQFNDNLDRKVTFLYRNNSYVLFKLFQHLWLIK